MTLNTDLANAARRVNALAARRPEQGIPDIAAEWKSLTDDIEGLPEPEARAVIAEWLRQMSAQLSEQQLVARPDPRAKPNRPQLRT